MHLFMKMKSFWNRTNIFIRFVTIGVLNTVISLTVIFFLLYFAKIGYWWSTFVGNSVGVVNSFYFNRSFTFRSQLSLRKGILPFFIVTYSAYFISYVFSDWFALFTPLPKKETAIFIGMLTYTVLNFFGQKYIVFSPNKEGFHP